MNVGYVGVVHINGSIMCITDRFNIIYINQQNSFYFLYTKYLFGNSVYSFINKTFNFMFLDSTFDLLEKVYF